MLTLAFAACVDPKASFDDFGKRERDLLNRDAGAEPLAEAGTEMLPSAAQMTGVYLFAVSTPLGPTTPVISLLDVRAASKNGGLEIQMRSQPLDASDRKTSAGPYNNFQSFDVDKNGAFDSPPINVSTPAAANPITPVDSMSVFILRGSLRGAEVGGGTDAPVEFWCGEIDGSVSAVGLTMSLVGSHFAAVRVPNPDDPSTYPQPLLNCHKDPAEALP